MVGYVFGVAVFNVMLGFALGVYLGQRYRRLVCSSDCPGGTPATLNSFSPVLAAVAGKLGPIGPVAKKVGKLLGIAQAEQTETSAAETTEAAPADVNPSEHTAQQAESPPESPTVTREKLPVEESAEKLRQTLAEYSEELVKRDNDLRSLGDQVDDKRLRQFVVETLELNDRLRESRNKAWEELGAVACRTPSVTSATQLLRDALKAQDSQLADTNDKFSALKKLEDLQQYRSVILKETTNLLAAADTVRDAVDQLRAAATGEMSAEDVATTARQLDEETSLLDRQAMEAKLTELWNSGQMRAAMAFLVDIDQMGRFNEKYSYTIGSRVISGVAKLIRQVVGDRGWVSRHSGQRFLVLLPESDQRFAVGLAERVRQTIETTTFDCSGLKLKVTVSCGIAPCLQDDSTTTLYARAEETLREAKRYGRNRSFVHDGELTSPVVPPNLILEEKLISV